MIETFSRKLNIGLTLVEVLIAASIVLVFVVALTGVHSLYLRTALKSGNVIKATYLAEEGIEAVRFLRNTSWDTNIATLILDTNYGMVFNGTTWQASTTNTTIDGMFVRTVVFSAVYRDSSQDIVISGGTLDPNTLKVTSTVSWDSPGASSNKVISTYLTNIFDS